MSLFNELERRNVFRVGIAYLVVSWLVLQVADVMIDNIGAPDWLFSGILLVLGIGFPIVLVFAWAFELTPEGIKRESEVDRSESIAPQTGKKLNNTILVLMALAIAYLLFDKFSGNRPDSVSTPAADVAQSAAQPETEPAPDSPPEISRQSIAVLPFDNRSARAEDEYFAEGIHDDLLTNLSRIGALKVISRTSVLRYRDTEQPIPEIARELGVATVMEGAVQRSGNQVRINVQLIDAATDEHLWAEIFDRELTAENLFAIQSEISEAIAGALQATLSPAEQQRVNARPTENLAAYDAYLRGRQLMATRNSEKLEEAIEEFRTAVTLDPQFALAWVGLADSFSLLSGYGSFPAHESVPLQEEALDKALAIDPGLGEAYASMSGVHEFHRRLQEAEAALQKAIELSPNYATAYQWYGLFLNQYPARANEQLALIRKAVELDPVSPIVQLNLGAGYLSIGEVNASRQHYLRLAELHPAFSRTYWALSRLEASFGGRLDEALRYAIEGRRNDPGGLLNSNREANIYTQLGDEQAAQRVLSRMEEMNADHPLTINRTVNLAAQFGSKPAVRETLNWALPKLEQLGAFDVRTARIALVLGDLDWAKALYLKANPEWGEQDSWDALLAREFDEACIVSWVFDHTGDPELGEALRRAAMRYFDEYLPAVTRHPDVHNPELCYLAEGDKEKALVSLETQFAHGHLDSWKLRHQLPLYDPLRDDPRYVDLTRRFDTLIAEQIARVQAAEWSKGP
jgi:TolB-like protein